MDFNLTEEQQMIRDAARDFAHNELLPGVIYRDENQEFPTEQIKKMGEMGFLGIRITSYNVCYTKLLRYPLSVKQ